MLLRSIREEQDLTMPEEITTTESAPEQNDHQLVEIVDPEIDPEQIMLGIRQRMQAERKKRSDDQQGTHKFRAEAMPDQIFGLGIQPDLFHYLEQANDTFPRVDMSMLLAESPATRLPIIGQLWKLIRGGAHQLVLFYVNRNANHQFDVNRSIVSTLNHMTALAQEQQKMIIDLQKEIKTLQQP